MLTNGTRVNRFAVIRGFAAIMVVVVHISQNFANLDWILRLNPLFEIGKYGVALFFVLSAFLLTKTLDNASQTFRNLLNFYLRRIFRILPAYYFCLAILIHFRESNEWQILSHFFLFFGLSSNTFGGINYPFWSIYVELTFYLLLPPLIWWGVRSCNQLPIYLIAFGVVWQVLSGYLRQKFGFDENYNWSARFFVLTAMPSFAIGIYGYVQKSHSRLKITDGAVRFGLLLVIFDFLTRLYMTLSDRQPIFILQFESIMHGSFGYLAYGSLGFFLLSWRGPGIRKYSLVGHAFQFLAFVGRISFSVYLWHLPILMVARNIDSSMISILSSCIMIGLVSYFSYLLIEKPFHDFAIRHFKLT